ncbi:hypothetical protein SAMN05428944_0462 [Streptomyces sp. 1222.5]|uniref:hypothetical protein n=1 Tax=unclassified Streptomyces TaxID=2593676 RepID=UPI00089D153C|nr:MULTISPECIES: hypothetical protein [unclassified Streptomyces]PKW12289.1 hypothetical protein BX260_7634 [Streptomyces sp. 5112.2]SEB59027.1 hypothetical protein SAMN05428944_0462 [Streptomyces sp. 1222.5]SEE35476.1 hypothetical protein SAMN05216532_7888 [Streptomyces sp. 2231.1]
MTGKLGRSVRAASDLCFRALSAAARRIAPGARASAREQTESDLIRFRRARNRSGDSYPLW